MTAVGVVKQQEQYMKATSLAMGSLYIIGITMVQAGRADKPGSARERVSRVRFSNLIPLSNFSSLTARFTRQRSKD